jgi:putative nucleotide binding protein
LVRQKKYEDFAYVLDIFSASELKAQSSNIIVHRDENVSQLLGEDFFTLLEAATPKNNKPAIRSRLYIGKDVPRNILRILRRIGYDDLTVNAKMNLESVVLKILEENERRFVDFFNTARPLTPRMHALELIPGIGKKIAMKIIEEREIRSFESYEDLRRRGGMLDPVKALQQRILEELRNPEEKYRLFVRPPVSRESGK